MISISIVRLILTISIVAVMDSRCGQNDGSKQRPVALQKDGNCSKAVRDVCSRRCQKTLLVRDKLREDIFQLEKILEGFRRRLILAYGPNYLGKKRNVATQTDALTCDKATQTDDQWESEAWRESSSLIHQLEKEWLSECGRLLEQHLRMSAEREEMKQFLKEKCEENLNRSLLHHRTPAPH